MATLRRRLLPVLLFCAIGVVQSVGAAPTKVEFWHVWAEGTAEGDVVKWIVDGFNAAHQGEIEVESIVTDFWTFEEKLRLAIASGLAPDVIHWDTVTTKQRASEGLIVNLTPLMQRDGVQSDEFWPGAVDAGTYEGNIYSLPFNSDTRIFYYNNQHFAESGLDPAKPPVTWDELEVAAMRLTRRNADDSFDRIGFHPMWGNLTFLIWAWTNGGDVFDANGRPTINAPKNVEALEWVVGWIERYGKASLDEFALGFANAEPFTVEKVSTIIETNGYDQRAISDNPDLDLSISAVPYRETEASWSAGFDVEIVKTTPERHEAAWQFVKYMLREDVMREWSRATRGLGARPIAAVEAYPDDPNWIAAVNQMLTSVLTPYSFEVPDWWELTYPYIDATFALEEPPASALLKAQEAVMGRYRQHTP